MGKVATPCLVFLGAMLMLSSQNAVGEMRPPISSGAPSSHLPLIHPKDSNEVWQGAAPSIQTIVVTPGGVVYAGSFGMGLFRSTDKGQSWRL